MLANAACFWRTVLLLIFVLAMCYMGYVGGELLFVPACVRSLQLPDDTGGCNGDVALCNRTYSEVCYASMHNAFATTQDGIVVAQHRGCIRSALVHGVRAFMLDVHLTSQNELKLCHVSCATGAISLATTLDTFREFLALNPREVVTLFWEVGYDLRFNGNDVPDAEAVRLKTLLASAYADAGLLPYVYEMGSFQWPTLRAMVLANTRLVTFSPAGARTSVDTRWDLTFDAFVTQTPWNSANARELRANCALPGLVIYTPGRSLLMLNHFTTLGAAGVNTASTSAVGEVLGIDALRGVNRSPWMEQRLVSCARCLGMFPNFIAVDFWQSSDVLQVVAQLNVVPPTARAASFQKNNSFCV